MPVETNLEKMLGHLILTPEEKAIVRELHALYELVDSTTFHHSPHHRRKLEYDVIETLGNAQSVDFDSLLRKVAP